MSNIENENMVKFGGEIGTLFGNTITDIPKRKRFDFDLDTKFWALIPNVNLNLHSNEIELEFLCFSLYILFKR